MKVYVIANNGEPLMPCEPVVARLLLKSQKAKVIRREPFTIKMLIDTKHYTQNLTCGVDTGSGTAGFAVANENGDVFYASEIEMRDDIKDKMDRRRMYRRNRRNRKTRYRKPRFNNRRASKRENRLSPTMQSKLDAHEREISFIEKTLPITKLVIEGGQFDMQYMQNPWIRNEGIIHWGYQHGVNYGFENTRMMVLNRDNYTCQCCKGKRKDNQLEVHHIVYRSKSGSDEPDNLITLCHTCHSLVHSGEITLNADGKTKGTLKYASQMNIIRSQILKLHPEAVETYGYVTSANRKALGLDKTSHWMDASVIATGGKKPVLITDVIFKKKCIAKGDFQQTKGIRSEKTIPTCKISGFKKFDKVQYFGKEYFIKGRMSSGYAFLMDIYGRKADFSNMPNGMKTPKLKNMKRKTARSSWMISSEAVI